MDARELRRVVIQQSRRANVGHIGSALCVADIVASLYGGVLRVLDPADPDRDRFVLSKGHAALALYAAFVQRGWLDAVRLDEYCSEDTLLSVHPEAQLRGVDFCTGSLGHGLSMAGGAALAAKMQRSDRRVFCLVSDAECNEGSVWEAIMFAAQHRLSNLTAIVDDNGQQAFGLTKEVIDQANLGERWAAFGWSVEIVDGHDRPALDRVLTARGERGPRVVIARTTFGKGVSFMEQGRAVTQTHIALHRINWHYLPMSEAEYAEAMQELGGLPPGP